MKTIIPLSVLRTSLPEGEGWGEVISIFDELLPYFWLDPKGIKGHAQEYHFTN